MILKKCSKCKTKKDISAFVKDVNKKDGYRNICKKCHRDDAKRRRELNKEHHSKIGLKSYYKNKKYLKSIEDPHDDIIIKAWVKRNHSRSDLKSKKKRKLCKDFLYKLCLKAIDHFGYITFRKEDGPKAYLASIDRIDSDKGYTENNVRIIPMWLNSAKLDLNWEELEDIMYTLLESDELKHIYK